MSYFMPADKICDKINQKDSQICELKYGKLKVTSEESLCSARGQEVLDYQMKDVHRFRWF